MEDEKVVRVRKELKEQIKDIILSNNKITNKSADYIPKNCQLYKFQYKKCSKKFKHKFSLKLHTTKRACIKQDFSCWYCDQRFTQDKSVNKHIQHNRCRNINFYRYTKDKSVFANNTDTNEDFDEFILQHNHAPVKMKRVNDTDIARIMTGDRGKRSD